MSGTRTATEILRALLVLALIFLSFAHQPSMAAPSAGNVMSVVASQSFCGTPIADDKGHAPCHACRIGSGADLPPTIALPCPPMPVALRLEVEPNPIAIERHAPLPAGARAPPAA